ENVEIIGQYSANAIGQVEYTLPLPGNFYFRTTSQFGIPTTGKYNFEKGIIPDVFVNDWELEEYLLNKKSQ
ncbi:MAG: hypothetical protein ACPGVH_10280, partial [Chitinophagales bacterium]